ncbi:hypothetical protein BK660_09270 [Pseudomonas brassicacearum]|uniref:Uncharacterized protein n=1 Tax=Pseudomonas brassicacearum TaxID=930166 RepID=A0A423I8R0_9PSED|nr:hypothetical protein BK660_09270 [Pseudomonas brassicacearum]
MPVVHGFQQIKVEVKFAVAHYPFSGILELERLSSGTKIQSHTNPSNVISMGKLLKRLQFVTPLVTLTIQLRLRFPSTPKNYVRYRFTFFPATR